MTTMRICERWDVPVPETGDEPWFADWALRSPRQAGRHLTAGWLALAQLRASGATVQSVVEYFGGIGAQALMVEALWAPQEHVVMDYAAAAGLHLVETLPDHVQVRVCDSYAAEPWCSDLAVLDFGDMTAHKLKPGQPHAQLLDGVASLQPEAILLTDIAARYLHLHVGSYESLLGRGTCGSYPDYLEALVSYIERQWGYTLHVGYWDRWSTVMALVPDGGARRGPFRPTPNSPVGLELLP